MKHKWEINYKNHKIELVNNGFSGEELYIDDTQIDKTRTFFGTSRMITKLEDEYIIAEIKGGFSLEASIKTTDNKVLLYFEEKQIGENFFLFGVIFLLVILLSVSYGL